MNFLVLAAQPWAQALYWETLQFLPGDWVLATTPDQADRLLVLYAEEWHRVFVLHWHWILKPEVVDRWSCIGFHASDLPQFRGGDPIGNQLKRGVLKTKITAFQLDHGIDTGPILSKLPLTLLDAPDVYQAAADFIPQLRPMILERCAGLVARMIPGLAYRSLQPTPQPPGGSFYRREDAR